MHARILVVEDERAIRLAVCGLLRRSGYEVEVAGNGPDALTFGWAKPTDVTRATVAGSHYVVLQQWDFEQGFQRYREIRPETAVVMITAHGTEEIAVQAIANGAADYVAKPFDNDELRVIVARVLEPTAVSANGSEIPATDDVTGTVRSIGMVRQSLPQKIREHDLRSEDWVRAS